MGKRRTEIELTHLAFNPQSARAFGHVFKLGYATEATDRAELQIFADGPEAEAGDWSAYGAPEAQRSRLVLRQGESGELVHGTARFAVKLVRVGERQVRYPNGVSETVPVRRFSITRLA